MKRRKFGRMSSIVVAGVLVAGLLGCGQNDSGQGFDTGHIFDPIKADALSASIGGCNVVHRESGDLKTVSARLVGRIAPRSDIVTADFPVDCSRCQVLNSSDSDVHDCQFYDACQEVDLDCQETIQDLIGMPLLSNATFANVLYTRMAYPLNTPSPLAGKTVEHVFSEAFDCQVLEITVAGKQAALADASGIGFYFDGQFAYWPMELLESVRTIKFTNGEDGELYQFGGLVLCWAGSMTSFANGSVEFKPFMRFDADGRCYLNWDDTDFNDRISIENSAFDRMDELFQ